MGNLLYYPPTESATPEQPLISTPDKTEVLKTVLEVSWEFQSNPDPWSTAELPKWKSYSAEEIKAIEKAFQEKQETVQVGDYIIKFEPLVQIHKDEPERVRPVRRTERIQRELRFCSELIAPKTFSRVTYTGDPIIVERWLNKRKFNFKIDSQGMNITDEKDMPMLREIVAFSIKGILEEGQKDNWESFAQSLTKRLEDCIEQNPENIFKECIYAYTKENISGGQSLYKVANKALRETDLSKVDTLGPFCYLLHFALKELSDKGADLAHSGVVYRGLCLDKEMLEMYKIAWRRGLQISFSSFVSTSKEKGKAESFSLSLKENQQFVLLVIENLGGASIASFSAYPGEQEVLLPASRGFEITDICEGDVVTTISLKMVNTKLESIDLEKGLSNSPILLSHSPFSELLPILYEWGQDRKIYFEIDDSGANITPEDKSEQLREFVKIAAEGIEKFGELLNTEEKRKKGREAANILMTTMNERPKKIFKIIVRLYAIESFLCKQINKILRSESPGRLCHLGPFCYLLNSYMIAANRVLTTSSRLNKEVGMAELHKALPLRPNQINIFKELYEKNLHFAFSSFTSTFREKNAAERALSQIQDNQVLLCSISIPISMDSAFDLLRFSVLLGESEVLIPPNVSFKIIGIDIDSKVPQIKLEFIDYII